jgi:hypothetical protein
MKYTQQHTAGFNELDLAPDKTGPVNIPSTIESTMPRLYSARYHKNVQNDSNTSINVE